MERANDQNQTFMTLGCLGVDWLGGYLIAKVPGGENNIMRMDMFRLLALFHL